MFGRVLAGAGVNREDVSYVEMHGTGTQAGDPCEMDAVLSVFAPPGSTRAGPLHLGSAKANIGHAESASGVASLIKVLLMMKHEQIPPHVGIKTRINRNFPSDLAQRNVHIAHRAAAWSRPSLLSAPHGRRAFVNNFGAAGGNSSVLLEDAPLPTDEESPDPRPVHLVAVSARTKTALQRNIRALREHLDTTVDISLSLLSYTTTARRMHHSFHAMVAGSSLEEIRVALCSAENRTNASISSTTAPPISFCFTGQGCQYLGMGRELLEMPPLRAIMVRLEGLVRLHGFPSILSVLDGSSNVPLEDLTPVQTQLAQTYLQMALTKYWQTLGIITAARRWSQSRGICSDEYFGDAF
jgi:naphtho-gamma-pyrone polyketide synthase